MRQRLWRAALGVSLTLACLVMALWVRSRYVVDTARLYPVGAFTTKRCLYTLECDRGSLVWDWTSEFDGAGGQFIASFMIGQRHVTLFSQPSGHGTLDDYKANHRGLFFRTFDNGGGWYGGSLVIPIWALLGASLVLPVIQLTRIFRRERALALNCCAVCGYDLRATPQRCPECGTAILART
jgi:hypothetical protein